MDRATVVVADSDVRVLNYVQAILADGERSVVVFESGKRAVDRVAAGLRPQVVLISNDLADADCFQVIRRINQLSPHSNIVVVSYQDCPQDFVDAIRAGACTVLFKPFVAKELKELVASLSCAVQTVPESAEVELPIGQHMSLVYASPRMHQLEKQASLIARVNLPVLILGESGTGKEIVARYLHNLSPRAANSFLKVNCAAVPSELLESELFGYEPGAFTGAKGSKPGKFGLCNHGTMFLDEIGEMHPALQAKLLQVLQDGTYSPLGSRASQKVDVRILAATNIDIKLAIASRSFREDLYYRLNGFCIEMPSLRERQEDIPVLLRYFIRQHAQALGFSGAPPRPSARLLKACLRYQWPGNVRELESFVKRYLVLDDEQCMIDELSHESPVCQSAPEIDPNAIRHALHLAGGNRRTAARTLGISYKVLLHRLREFGMEPEGGKPWRN